MSIEDDNKIFTEKQNLIEYQVIKYMMHIQNYMKLIINYIKKKKLQ